jgi:hypothetical protein
MKVEDFLNALGDLCAEALKTGEAFRVRGIGSFMVTRRLSPKGNKIRASIVFQASENLLKRLGFPDDEPIRKVRGLCRAWGLQSSKVAYTTSAGGACERRHGREKQEMLYEDDHQNQQSKRRDNGLEGGDPAEVLSLATRRRSIEATSAHDVSRLSPPFL